jgi:predicted amidophosphoribosyltransferase
MRKLKDPCANCGKPLDPQWPICPYCEAEVPGHAPVPRRRRRRQATSEVEQGATASFETPPSP